MNVGVFCITVNWSNFLTQFILLGYAVLLDILQCARKTWKVKESFLFYRRKRVDSQLPLCLHCPCSGGNSPVLIYSKRSESGCTWSVPAAQQRAQKAVGIHKTVMLCYPG